MFLGSRGRGLTESLPLAMLWPEWMVRLPVTRSKAPESSVKLQVLATEMSRVSPPTYSMPPPVIFWKCPPELQMILICSNDSTRYFLLHLLEMHAQHKSSVTAASPWTALSAFCSIPADTEQADSSAQVELLKDNAGRAAVAWRLQM